jgi:hypothetical protein
MGEDGFSIVVFDSVGEPTDTLFRRPLAPPTREPSFPGWRGILAYYATVSDDTAFVVATLSDSLWWVALANGAAGAMQLRFDGYVPPDVPSEAELSTPNRFAWADSFHRAASPQASASTIAAPFVRGILTFGAPNTTIVRLPSGSWVALAEAPPVLAVSDDTLIALLHPEATGRTLGKFLLSDLTSSPP